MSPSLRHIPIRDVVSSAVHLRYLDEDPELEPFLGMRPRDPADLLRRAPLNARRLVSAEALAHSLMGYAQRHGAPEQVLESARAVARGDCHMVITGQQPGLFGGPLYTIHKAATAVRLARELNALPQAPRVVPVFWNHTDDHDLDEVNRAFFVNSNLEVQRLRLELSRGGESIRDIMVGRAMDHALAAVEDLLPNSEFREWTLEIFRPHKQDEQLGDGLARLLFTLFGQYGLLVIEPRDLPEEAYTVLPRWWEQAEEIRETTKSCLEDLADLGLDIGLDPAATLMFQTQGNRRSTMAEGDPVRRVTALSPGALLRPLWQDACLPTISSVVGPGELGYLAVAGSLYRQLGVPAPVLAPRASLTLVEPSLVKLLERFGWDLKDLDSGPENLVETLAGVGPGPGEETLEKLAGRLALELRELAKTMGKTDPQMERAVERCRGKLTEEMAKLAVKLRNSRKNREGTGLRQIRRLHSNLKPRGRPQERVLTALPFMAGHGPELAQHLVAAACPFTTGHGILEL